MRAKKAEQLLVGTLATDNDDDASFEKIRATL